MELFETLNQLYYQISLDELRHMNEDAPGKDISYNSLLYLDLISYQPGCTVSYLAKALHISKPAVTSKVNELIRQGLVTKTQSEQDKRVYHLAVAPAIQADYACYDRRLRHAAQQVQAHYSPQQVEMLCQMLGLIAESYLEYTE